MEKRYKYAVLVILIAAALVVVIAVFVMGQTRSAEGMVLQARDMGNEWDQTAGPESHAGDGYGSAYSEFKSGSYRTVNCEVRVYDSSDDASGYMAQLKDDLGQPFQHLESVSTPSLGDECIIYKTSNMNGLYVAILLKGDTVVQVHYQTVLESSEVSVEFMESLMTAQAGKIY